VLHLRGQVMMVECCRDTGGRLGTSKPKGECVAIIADGVALKAVAFALVRDP
jgi:hypothetical protein